MTAPAQPASARLAACRGLLAAAIVAVAACRDSTDPVRHAAALDVAGVPTEVAVGDTVAAPVRVLDGDGHPIAGRAPAVTTSAPDVLRVLSDGRLIGVATGAAVLHVETGGTSGTLLTDVPVRVARRVTAVRPIVRVQSLFTGDTLTVGGDAVDRFSVPVAGAPLRFSSSDTTILVVDSLTGLVTARNDGPATITVRSGSVSGTVLLQGALPMVRLPGRATAITMSPFHACALVGTGEAWCWGANRGGLGIDDATSPARWVDPVPVAGGLRFTSIDADGNGTCALTADHVPWCWGESATPGSRTPIRIAFGDGSQVAAGVRAHGDGGGCIVDTGGGTWCWGSNVYRQLGDVPGTAHAAYARPPRPIPGGLRWAEFEPGFEHSCGLTVDGGVSCLGAETAFGLAGSTTAAALPTIAPGTAGARAFTIGWQHTCVLDAAGVVSCGGWNEFGELGRGTTQDAALPFAPIASSLRFVRVKSQFMSTCALTATGELWCWGKLGFGAVVRSANVPNTQYAAPGSGTLHLFSRALHFVDFAVGAVTACGLTADGLVFCGTRALGDTP